MHQRFLGALQLALASFIAVTSAVHARPLTLSYFDSRGRAEPIRLALNALGVSYIERKFGDCADCEVWADAKSEFPFGQVPSITLPNGEELPQTIAILQHIAREHDFYGGNGNEHRTDMIMNGVMDVRSRYGKMAYSADHDLEAYADVLATWLSYFEAILGDRKFFVGDSLSVSDVMVWDMLDLNLRVVPAALNNFNALRGFHRRLVSAKSFGTYLATRRKYANGKSAFIDNEANPPPNHADYSNGEYREILVETKKEL